MSLKPTGKAIGGALSISWGLNVNFDKFIGDAITGEYVDLTSSRADFAHLAAPPVILVSPRNDRPIEHTFGPQYQSLTALATAQTSVSFVSLPDDVSGESGTNNERRTATVGTQTYPYSLPHLADHAPPCGVLTWPIYSILKTCRTIRP